ncbi:MAG: phosphoglycerate kinase [Desulfococcaceae bacterium]
MKSVYDVDLKKKRVFIRVDFNVPLDESRNITDDARIREALPTIRYALDQGAKVIVASHMGRPKGKAVPEFSMAPAARRLGELLGKEVKTASDCIGPEVRKLADELRAGDVMMLENLRYHSGEEKNEDGFAKELAGLCDVYVNDAFAVCHRINASVGAIVKFAPVSVAGILLKKELDYFRKAMSDPRRPLAAIVGGAKVSGKLKALENMLAHVDRILIGGAMANTFLKFKGCDMGKSKLEDDLTAAAGAVMEKAREKGIRFYLPVDVVAADRLAQDAVVKILPPDLIPQDWMALDIGPATVQLYREVLQDAKTIVWNGPVGVFETDAFSRGTLAMVECLANSHALTIVGGGDTDAAVHMAGEKDRISYISTGGGAFLALLEGKTLPAVKALEEAA